MKPLFGQRTEYEFVIELGRRLGLKDCDGRAQAASAEGTGHPSRPARGRFSARVAGAGGRRAAFARDPAAPGVWSGGLPRGAAGRRTVHDFRIGCGWRRSEGEGGLAEERPVAPIERFNQLVLDGKWDEARLLAEDYVHRLKGMDFGEPRVGSVY